MVQLHHVLSVVLLTAPPAHADAPGLGSYFAVLQQPLQSLAVQLEILDPREVRYILAKPEDFLSDLNLLRRRYRDLADAPQVQDGFRFPDRATVNDLLALNRAYRQHVDVRQPVELVHWWELRSAMQETDRLYQIWDKVRDARCDYYYVTVRRQALKQLRELVGEDAYYGGDLPPCVPLWHLSKLN